MMLPLPLGNNSMYYIMVKRGEFQRFDLLHRTFGSLTSVVWDPRGRDRRLTADPYNGEERRTVDRRGPVPASWKALSFIVVERPT